MWITVLRRIGLSILTVWMVTILVFAATEVLPGDALEVSLTSDELAMMTPQDLAQKRHELGLDRPALMRYTEWLKNAVHGDFGKTIIGRVSVSEIIYYPMRNSFLLAMVAALVAIPVALLLGIIAACFYGRWPDSAASTWAIVGYSIPEFASGNVLVLCFAIWLPLLPAVILTFTDAAPSALLAVSVLPVATIVFGSIAHLVRLVREGFVEVLNSDYVERARLTGVSNIRLVLRHALPASIIPALNSAALYVAGLLSGLIVVEKVFAYPGLGLVLIKAIHRREEPVVEAIALIAAICVIVMNLLADIAVIALDPRVRRK